MRRLVLSATQTFGIATLVAVLAAPAAAQLEFEWDGETSDDWFETTNWTVFGGDPDPSQGDPLVPDTTIRVEIAEDGTGSAPAPVIRNTDAFAGEVRIGRSAGAGALTIESGSLSTGSGSTGIKFRVGNGGPATFDMLGGELNLVDGTMVTGNGSNSTGQVNISGGVINIIGSSRDLNMDEGNPAAGSNLTITAGELNIGDVLLVDGTATVDASGGAVNSVDDFRIRNGGVVNLSGGTWLTGDKIDIGEDPSEDGGSLFVSGGLIRGNRLSIGGDGLITISDDGLMQVGTAEASVSSIEALITGGQITGPSPLSVSLVDVGGTDFIQVSAATAMLLGDADGDGDVDGDDLIAVQTEFGSTGSAPLLGDADGDGDVDGDDLIAVQTNFGEVASVAVPEPAAVALLGLGIASLSLLRRREG